MKRTGPVDARKHNIDVEHEAWNATIARVTGVGTHLPAGPSVRRIAGRTVPATSRPPAAVPLRVQPPASQSYRCMPNDSAATIEY